MMKNFLNSTASAFVLLSVFSTFAPSQAMEDELGKERISTQRQPDRQETLIPTEEKQSDLSPFFKEYVNLFLTPFDRLMLEGNSEAAMAYVRSFAKKYTSAEKITGTRNFALDAELSPQYRTFGGLESTERFQPFYFRNSSTNENDAIQKCKENIDSLINARLLHLNKIKGLHKKKEEGPSVYEDIQSWGGWVNGWIDDSIECIQGFSSLPKLSPILDSYAEHLKKNQLKIKTREEINMEEENAFIKKYSKELKSLRSDHIRAPDLSVYQDVYNEIVGSKKSRFHDIRSYNDSLTVSKNEPLSFDEREALKNSASFLEDTDLQIAREEKKIAFIQTHPWFFKVQNRDRFELIGAQNLPSNTQHGDGVSVGIIDSFLMKQSTIDKSPLFHKTNIKCIRQVESYKGLCEEDLNRIDEQHGIHVAGIVASDQHSDKDSRPLGIAPQAQVVFFDRVFTKNLESGLTITDQRVKSDTKADISVSAHLRLLDRLKQEDQGVFHLNLNYSRTTYAWDHEKAEESNAFFKTPVKLFNVSLAATAFGKNGKIGSKTLDFFDLIWTVVLRPDALFVIGLGNDQMDISTSNSFGRAARALTQHSATQKGVIFVTNLMEDGMSLFKSSNVPGNNPYLQKRTLSAAGTNVESTMIPSTFEKDRGLMTGTSMAAPKVTGATAVVLSNYPHLTNEITGDCLLKGATPLLYDENHFAVFELKNYTAASLTSLLEEHSEGIEIAKDQFISSSSIDVPSHLKVTKKWWEKSQELFGQGRVNIKGALDFAENFRKL